MFNLKEISYKLFSLHYRLGSMFPIQKGRVFSIMTHDSSETGNIRALVRYMKTKGSYSFFYFEEKDRKQVRGKQITSIFSVLFKLPLEMARAEYIVMDNAFLPMAFFKVRKGSKVVQLWHGTGSIKKFAQDANEGRLKLLEARMNENIDFLIVNADSQVEQYAKAFGVEQNRVRITGLPRTDWLLKLINDEKFEEKIIKTRNKIGQFLGRNLDGRNLILYAPTFRDNEVGDPKLHLDILKLLKRLPEEVTILLRLHPHVARAFCGDVKEERICNVSFYPELNELLAGSDAVITDYSSIVFDFALFERPMYFYADDLENFMQNGRGLYLNYKSDLPGMFARNVEELAEEMKKTLQKKESPLYSEKRKEFLKKYYKFLDGNSAKRVYETCILEKNQ